MSKPLMVCTSTKAASAGVKRSRCSIALPYRRLLGSASIFEVIRSRSDIVMSACFFLRRGRICSLATNSVSIRRARSTELPANSLRCLDAVKGAYFDDKGGLDLSPRVYEQLLASKLGRSSSCKHPVRPAPVTVGLLSSHFHRNIPSRVTLRY